MTDQRNEKETMVRNIFLNKMFKITQYHDYENYKAHFYDEVFAGNCINDSNVDLTNDIVFCTNTHWVGRPNRVVVEFIWMKKNKKIYHDIKFKLIDGNVVFVNEEDVMKTFKKIK